MKSIRVSAPGKLILLGEHIVVYGKPALISSVAKRCHVTLTPTEDKKIEIISQNLNLSLVTTKKEVLNQTLIARKQWEKFSQTNDVTILKAITKNPLDFPLLAIGESLLYFKKPLPSGFTLTIDSEIPVGAGMGSSASLAVAVAGALSLLLTGKLDKEIVNTIAFATEQRKHGFPSGGDNSICCYGGLIWYRKETPEMKIIQEVPFSIPPPIAKNFLTVFTGTPQESTGELVSAVRTLYTKNQKHIDALFASQEILVRNLLTAIKQENKEEVSACIRQGEANLEKLGVVSPMVKKLIGTIEKAGGAAKICGAGGKTKGTGMVLVYTKNKQILEKLLKTAGFSYSSVSLGTDGVKEEKLMPKG